MAKKKAVAVGEGPKAITFQALFNKAETTRDGGWILRLELDSTQANAILLLDACKESLLSVAVVPDEAAGPVLPVVW